MRKPRRKTVQWYDEARKGIATYRPSSISECKKCSRMYLDKLGCIFCNVYEKNRKVLQYK